MKSNDSIVKPSGRMILNGILTAVIIAAALFLCWWKGLFIPGWATWKEKSFVYEEARVQLENHCLKVITKVNAQNLKVYFQTPWDWNVQDVLPFDINHDGQEELVLLVWKHGSYGDHLPFWVKNNDIRLEQHIFIYQWDESREEKLRPVWMSSSLGYEVLTVARGADNSLIVTDSQAKSLIWKWEDFGLILSGEARKEIVNFLAAGDNLIHPQLLLNEADNYDYLYDHVRNDVMEADVASINQETIFVEDHGLISGFPKFGTPVEVGNAIVNAGFDVVTLATNHVLDKELYGIRVTTSFYEEQEGLTYVGVNAPDYDTLSPDIDANPENFVKFIEKNGIRIALLNYTYGTNGIPSPGEYPYIVERFRDEERMLAQIDYARSRADTVIVFAHWGTEYSKEPDDEQLRICNLLLDHEVDVIIGTHPHVLQPCELLEDEQGHEMLVYYSLGNLISGQDKTECQMGGLAKFAITKSPAGNITIEDAELKKIVSIKRK